MNFSQFFYKFCDGIRFISLLYDHYIGSPNHADITNSLNGKIRSVYELNSSVMLLSIQSKFKGIQNLGLKKPKSTLIFTHIHWKIRQSCSVNVSNFEGALTVNGTR